MLSRCKLHDCNPLHERKRERKREQGPRDSLYIDEWLPETRPQAGHSWRYFSGKYTPRMHTDTRTREGTGQPNSEEYTQMHIRTQVWTHTHTYGYVHTRDSFAIGRNYGGNEGAVHRTTRINLHLRHPRGRHANSLSYCTPRRISRRTINFLRAVADSARYPVRSLCPFPGRTAPVPIGPEFPGWWIVASGCLSADERRFSLSG